MTNFVDIEVQEVKPSGVYVKILNDPGVVGFIRRRELTWDRRIAHSPLFPKPGTRLEAVILEQDNERDLTFLSLKRITDPWADLKLNKRYSLEQSIRGEVVNIRYFGAFIQLEPGIDALLRPEDMPKSKNLTNDIWIGDQVYGKITAIDIEHHAIQINLSQIIKEFAEADNREQILLDRLGLQQAIEGSKSWTMIPFVSTNNESVKRYHTPISRLGHILVIDDDKVFLSEICQRLPQEFEVEVTGVHTGKEAIIAISSNRRYELAIIDVRLKNETGFQVGEQLKKNIPTLSVLFMSRSLVPRVDDQYPSNLKDPLIEKEIETIIDWIDKLRGGYFEEEQIIIEDNSKNERISTQLHQTVFAEDNLSRKLQNFLKIICSDLHTDYGVIVKLDSMESSVAILAANLEILEFTSDISPGGLYNSQVRNVIEDQIDLCFSDIQDYEKKTKFRNLFPSISYRSCFGAPILIPDEESHFALFLFDKRPWFYSRKNTYGKAHIREARLAASYLALAIERDSVMETLREHQDISLQGYLMADMVHELNNKQSGLRTQIARLNAILTVPQEISDEQNIGEIIAKAKEISQEIIEAEEEQRNLINAYQRLVRQDFEVVDINEIVRKVVRQLKHHAMEANIEIQLDLHPNLPPVYGLNIHFNQVLLNLVMNAILQIKVYRSKFALPNRCQTDLVSVPLKDLIIIQTTKDDLVANNPVQIKVSDSGPGIHWSLQNQIFARGYSNRGGAGLGLTISRNLIEHMNGSLRLYSSFMFFGSTFLIELPVIKTREAI